VYKRITEDRFYVLKVLRKYIYLSFVALEIFSYQAIDQLYN